MAYFPLFIDISDKKCLIVGGGMVAYRKAEQLAGFDCKITVVSPQYVSEFEKLKGLKLIKRKFLSHDLEGCFMVIAATNETVVNTEIARLAKEKGIHINVVDVKEECSFFFPSIYKNGDVCAGITTGGKSPHIARLVRKKIANTIPLYYGDMAERMGKLRQQIKNDFADSQERKRVFGLILEKMLETENSVSDEEIQQLIRGEYGN